MKNAKKLKNMNIFIDEDFSPETMDYPQAALRRCERTTQEGNIVYLNYLLVVNEGMKRDN